MLVSSLRSALLSHGRSRRRVILKSSYLIAAGASSCYFWLTSTASTLLSATATTRTTTTITLAFAYQRSSSCCSSSGSNRNQHYHQNLNKQSTLLYSCLFSTTKPENDTNNRNKNPTIMTTTENRKTIKAIVFGKPNGTPAWSERPMPRLKRGLPVVVQVHGVGLNPVDSKGVIGDKIQWTRLKAACTSCLVHDTVIGFDFAGVVVASLVPDSFPVGAKVFGTMPPLQGSLAEYICPPLDQICLLPDKITRNNDKNNNNSNNDNSTTNRDDNSDLIQVCTVPLTGLTALQCLTGCIRQLLGDNKSSSGGGDDDDDAITLQGKKVLVVGASGGTGHMALQIARRGLQAETVVALCSNRNAQACLDWGATTTVDYRQAKTENDFVHQLAYHGPFDVIMDCVTSADPRDTAPWNYPQLLQQAPIVDPNSRYQYRRLGGPFTDWLRAGLERTVGYEAWGGHHEKLFWIQFPHSAPQLETLAKWMQEGKLQPQVTKVYKFDPESVKQAFDDINSRRMVGKVAVRVHSGNSTAPQTTTNTNTTSPPSQMPGYEADDYDKSRKDQ